MVMKRSLLVLFQLLLTFDPSYSVLAVVFFVSQQKLTQDKPGQSEEESILAAVMEQNTKLQIKVTGLTRQLADKENKFKSCKADLQKRESELSRLKMLLKQVDKPQTAPVVRQRSYVDADCDHKVRSLQRQYDNLQSFAKERDDLVIEVSQSHQEIKILQESLDHVTNQSSSSEGEKIQELAEHAKHFEVEYRTERDDNERLQAENEQLQQQLDTILVTETKLDALPVEDGGHNKVTIGRLQVRIKQLNEDVTKLREHSKGQSRQILRLRQQTEITKVSVNNYMCMYMCTCLYTVCHIHVHVGTVYG